MKKTEKSIIEDIYITPQTRMNELSIHIPFNQWHFGNTRSPRCVVRVTLGSMSFESVQHLISRLSEKLYARYVFAVYVMNKSSVRAEIPIAKKSSILDFDPPVRIASLKRGCIVNSVSNYDLQIECSFYVEDLYILIKFMEANASKDLGFQFTRIIDPEPKKKKRKKS